MPRCGDFSLLPSLGERLGSNLTMLVGKHQVLGITTGRV